MPEGLAAPADVEGFAQLSSHPLHKTTKVRARRPTQQTFFTDPWTPLADGPGTVQPRVPMSVPSPGAARASVSGPGLGMCALQKGHRTPLSRPAEALFVALIGAGMRCSA